jgi:predicted deacylase
VNDFEINGIKIEPGQRKKIDIDIAKLYDYTDMTLPLEVMRSKKDGPTLFVSAAMHGDEINGVEICRRLLQQKILKKIKGTLIVVPIINVFGFNNKSRYLPDRRDLNRSFPGSASGSLASRLADVFVKEIVDKSTHGIDLHTGAIHRSNLPQIRASLHVPETERLAKAFGSPVVINSTIRDGSLRSVVVKKDIRLLIYEAGEALRFDENAIRSGLFGILSVMKEIGMLEDLPFSRRKKKQVFTAQSSYWVRAADSGIVSSAKKLGARVKANELLCRISDPFSNHITKISAPKAGIIIGKSELPLVSEGDALFHIANFEDSKAVEASVESFEELIDENIDTHFD